MAAIVIKVLHSWHRKKALEISSLGKSTAKSMTGNSNFTTPAVPLTDMDAAAKRVSTAWNDRKNGDGGKTELKAALKDLRTKLLKQANYVDSIAQGKKEIILSAAFEATSGESHPAVELGQPNPAQTKVSSGGMVRMKTKRVPGATSYCWVVFLTAVCDIKIAGNHIILPPDNGGTIIIPTGGSIETISGLAPLKKIFAGVMARNAAGLSSMSAIVEVHTI